MFSLTTICKGRTYYLKRLSFSLLGIMSLSGCGSSDDNNETPEREPSVARQWNEIILEGIRNDFARPTVHARNLFHMSAAMYDAWAVHDSNANTYLLGKTKSGYLCDISDIPVPSDTEAYREASISYAAYRLINWRFRQSPDFNATKALADTLMGELNYDVANTATDYRSGSAAALGNALAECYIQYGLVDGANESNDYANTSYEPVNLPIQPEFPGNPALSIREDADWDRWQQIVLSDFIDQSGNSTDIPDFLSPEWGQVAPFALTDANKTTFNRDDFDYQVYYDPGMPPTHQGTLADEYKWGFTLVSLWSSHLDTTDNVMWDISPASVGNIQSYPTEFADFRDFYNTLDGGDSSMGYNVNPKTGAPYEPQMVPRGDYARVLAEFWADGPDSETPPGHWFTILNTVNDHPEFVRRFEGAGEELGHLEWDVKAYFALGGAMHDSAIAAWGIKGWYDYLRPISAIRAMADVGQSSDPDLPSYNPDGILLYDGLVELVEEGDPLAGDNNQFVGRIKLMAWRGPDFIDDPATDKAGVGWILAQNWWPYQRPTFVTPPFAGYVSGHSTYSRAAAELLTALTGDPYFPGGMSGFEVKANEFLVFEEGPSVDMTLQWATYRDASDQCSLSRIWGGIHPPADDIPGRLIGEKIGVQAFALAKQYFSGR